MRKILAGALSLVVALAVALTQAAPALAADEVIDSRCTATTTSLGRVCVYAWFDNTNCDAHTVKNCSGLNGAWLQRIFISTERGVVSVDNPLRLAVDTYGDGTSAYKEYRNIQFKQGENIRSGYFDNSVSGYLNNVNRICLRVRSFEGQGVNVGGLNPYGLSQAGACNF